MNRTTLTAPRQAPVRPRPETTPPPEAAPPALDWLLTFDPGVHILAHFRPTDLTPPVPEDDIRRWARELRDLALTNRAIAQTVRSVFGNDQRQLCWALRFQRYDDTAHDEIWRCGGGGASLSAFGAEDRLLRTIWPLLDPALVTPDAPDAARTARWRLALLVRPLVQIRYPLALALTVNTLMTQAASQAARPSAHPVDLTALAHSLLVAAGNLGGTRMVPAIAMAIEPLGAHLATSPPAAQAACFIELAVLHRDNPSALNALTADLARQRDGSPDADTHAVFDRAWDALHDIVGFLQAPQGASNDAVARHLERLRGDDTAWGPADVAVLTALSHLAQPPKGVACALPAELRTDTARAVRRWLRHLCALNKGHAHVREQFLLAPLQPTVLWHALRGLAPAQMCWMLRRNPGAPAHATLVSLVHALALDPSVPLAARIEVLIPWLAPPAPGRRDSLSERARAVLQADLDQLQAETHTPATHDRMPSD